ncbi:hypothetical protein ON010_g15289 [Phytophthora cinnamomi]|nr:hypothetical protein ON010_g15289 [Phytophthora cinnamomi]
MVEYEEARLIQALLYKDEMKTEITTKQVKEAIVELYSSTRMEITNYLQENREDYPNFTLVADFWTCKTTQDKFLGLRVYLVDKAWQYKSILLGTGEFNPAYGDRDGGILKPFKAWLKHMLVDFSLATSDFYGATSDSGGDVKSMLSKELNLHWEWCFAHMAHAATKSSCGVNGAASAAANPEMADLISRLVRTIFQVKAVSVTGSLFAELCKSKTKGASTRLVGYSTSHFLSMTRSLERVLERWPAITAWYEERAHKALRANQPPPEFPLANRHDDLAHLDAARSFAPARPPRCALCCDYDTAYEASFSDALFLCPAWAGRASVGSKSLSAAEPPPPDDQVTAPSLPQWIFIVYFFPVTLKRAATTYSTRGDHPENRITKQNMTPRHHEQPAAIAALALLRRPHIGQEAQCAARPAGRAAEAGRESGRAALGREAARRHEPQHQHGAGHAEQVSKSRGEKERRRRRKETDSRAVVAAAGQDAGRPERRHRQGQAGAGGRDKADAGADQAVGRHEELHRYYCAGAHPAAADVLGDHDMRPPRRCATRKLG